MDLFTRQLGESTGIQLNPLVDHSYSTLESNVGRADQCFAIMMMADRGRVDRPFLVTKDNFDKKLGTKGTLRQNITNEAWVHVKEALYNGASGAVIQRLSGVLASVAGVPVSIPNYNDWILAYYNKNNTSLEKADIHFKLVTDADKASKKLAGDYIAVAGNEISQNLFFLKHHECFNNGIYLSVHADEKYSALHTNVANDIITIRVLDSNKVELYEFTGSLDQTAKNERNESIYLGDVIASQTDDFEFCVGLTTEDDFTTFTPIAETTGASKYGSNAYGYNVLKNKKWVTSALLKPFQVTTAKADQSLFVSASAIEQASDISVYVGARHKLIETPYKYAYISTGGSLVPNLIQQSALLAYYRNAQLRYDVPAEDATGVSSTDQVSTFVSGLGLETAFTDENIKYEDAAHLIHGYWAPISSTDPTGVNINCFLGMATLNIAYACNRNKLINSKGFAPKHYPIAGFNYPINRTNLNQIFYPNSKDMETLARLRVNPVFFQTFSDGGRFIFVDSLTHTQNNVSLKKLISVVEMSTSIDDAIVRYGNEVLQLPMPVALKRLRDYLSDLFRSAESSGWIIPSNDPELQGKSHRFLVEQDKLRPYDRINIQYWVRYEGTLRQLFVTQTLTR